MSQAELIARALHGELLRRLRECGDPAASHVFAPWDHGHTDVHAAFRKAVAALIAQGMLREGEIAVGKRVSRWARFRRRLAL